MKQQEIDFQEKCRKFFQKEYAFQQTPLIEHLLAQEVDQFSYAWIENLYYSDDDEENPGKRPPVKRKVILEWWRVNAWLAKRLSDKGEVILWNDYGRWWGRCTSEIPIYMEAAIGNIVLDLEKA